MPWSYTFVYIFFDNYLEEHKAIIKNLGKGFFWITFLNSPTTSLIKETPHNITAYDNLTSIKTSLFFFFHFIGFIKTIHLKNLTKCPYFVQLIYGIQQNTRTKGLGNTEEKNENWEFTCVLKLCFLLQNMILNQPLKMLQFAAFYTPEISTIFLQTARKWVPSDTASYSRRMESSCSITAWPLHTDRIWLSYIRLETAQSYAGVKIIFM